MTAAAPFELVIGRHIEAPQTVFKGARGSGALRAVFPTKPRLVGETVVRAPIGVWSSSSTR